MAYTVVSGRPPLVWLQVNPPSIERKTPSSVPTNTCELLAARQLATSPDEILVCTHCASDLDAVEASTSTMISCRTVGLNLPLLLLFIRVVYAIISSYRRAPHVHHFRFTCVFMKPLLPFRCKADRQYPGMSLDWKVFCFSVIFPMHY